MGDHYNQKSKGTFLNTGIGMVFGAALGLPFGLILFEQPALGLIFGMLFGLIIGSIAEAQNKKKD